MPLNALKTMAGRRTTSIVSSSPSPSTRPRIRPLPGPLEPRSLPNMVQTCSETKSSNLSPTVSKWMSATARILSGKPISPTDTDHAT